MTLPASSLSAQVIECNVPDMEVNREGLKDYFWPIANPERTGFGLSLTTAYAEILRQYSDDLTMMPYKLFGVSFLVQVVAVFQADLLRERLKQEGKVLSVPDHWQYWPKIFQQKMPEEPLILATLKNGPTKVNYTKKILNFGSLKKIIKILNFKKSGLQIDGLKIKPLTRKVLDEDIIATQRTSLIVRHAKQVKKDVVFKRAEYWFDSVSDEELNDSIKLNNDVLEAKILAMIADQYSVFDIELKYHAKDFFKNLLQKGPAMMRVHYNRLLKDKGNLPQNIWTGTAGAIWDLILRVAVVESGGKATGHDHGSGCAYVGYPLRGVLEYWGCQSFITFNKNHAEEIAPPLQLYPRYDNYPPKMDFVNSEGDIQKIRKEYKKPKTVFLMGTSYDDDNGRIGPGNVNNFLVDWQARLITLLKNAGYDVVLKVHPETPVMPPKAYEELGAKISMAPFGSIMDQADVVLFDCIFTTAFTDCLATNIPVVLTDWFGFPWTEKGKELIEKRCPIVPIEYKNCRAYPDAGLIVKAIEAAPMKCENHEFYTHYFL